MKEVFCVQCGGILPASFHTCPDCGGCVDPYQRPSTPPEGDVFNEEGEWLEGPFGQAFVGGTAESAPTPPPSPNVWSGVPVDRKVLGDMIRIFVAETGKDIPAIMVVRAALNIGLREARLFVEDVCGEEETPDGLMSAEGHRAMADWGSPPSGGE